MSFESPHDKKLSTILSLLPLKFKFSFLIILIFKNFQDTYYFFHIFWRP